MTHQVGGQLGTAWPAWLTTNWSWRGKIYHFVRKKNRRNREQNQGWRKGNKRINLPSTEWPGSNCYSATKKCFPSSCLALASCSFILVTITIVKPRLKLHQKPDDLNIEKLTFPWRYIIIVDQWRPTVIKLAEICSNCSNQRGNLEWILIIGVNLLASLGWSGRGKTNINWWEINQLLSDLRSGPQYYLVSLVPRLT